MKVAVIIGKDAHELERFAAEQLCDYLQRLFDIYTRPTQDLPPLTEVLFLVSSSDTNLSIKYLFPKLMEIGKQDIMWQRLYCQDFEKEDLPVSHSILLIGGGSPQSTLWAVYELVEKWGVRYLLHGDVLPEKSRFQLPDVDLVMEPALPVRQWRVINDFACGPESWGMADYRIVIDQLAKLKFNRILLSLWPWQPFLHYQVKGIERRSATLWFGFHYPITDDMIGRDLFGDEIEFWNPDLPYDADYQELTTAGIQFVRDLIDYAHKRGIESVVTATLTEFPPEFAPLLKESQKVRQLAELTIVPGAGTEIDDPILTDLAATVLQATVNTYPRADYVALGMPEFRQWADMYHKAWKILDDKYQVSAYGSLEDILDSAKVRIGYAGGPDRAVQEVKGDIVALYFYDRLIRELKVLEGTHCPDIKFIYSSVAEELFPILPYIIPAGGETLNFVDYTASRIVQRRDVLKNVSSSDIPCSLIYTLHDDNVGVLPQLATGSLHQLTKDLRQYGWSGFSTRYWLVSDHNPCIAYLARASWSESVTPDTVYRDQIQVVCGVDCVEDMVKAFHLVEMATTILEMHGLGLTFPVPGMLMKHWVPNPISSQLVEVRQTYQQALKTVKRARKKVQKRGEKYIDYWIGRLEFGIGYLEMIFAVRQASIAETNGKPAEANHHAKIALEFACRALASYANVAQDRSDLGSIAVMNEYVHRPLKAKISEMNR